MMTVDTPQELLRDLAAAGIELDVRDGKLRYRPAIKVTTDLQERMRRHKNELIAAVSHPDHTPPLADITYSVKELAILKRAGLGPADVPVITSLKALFGTDTPVRVTDIQPKRRQDLPGDGDTTPPQGP